MKYIFFCCRNVNNRFQQPNVVQMVSELSYYQFLQEKYKRPFLCTENYITFIEKQNHCGQYCFINQELLCIVKGRTLQMVNSPCKKGFRFIKICVSIGARLTNIIRTQIRYFHVMRSRKDVGYFKIIIVICHITSVEIQKSSV